MLLEFNPNSPAITKIYNWATYVPTRITKPFKLHSNRGHALNAIGQTDNGILYEFDYENNQWKEIFRLENGVERKCYICDKDTSLESSYYRRWVGKKTNQPKLVSFCREHYYNRSLRHVS